MIEALLSYLSISPDYDRNLKGLHWSANGDAIESEDGSTFAFADEIGLFIEGFASTHRLVSFEHVLHALQLLGYGNRKVPEEAAFVAKLFKSLKRPLRNAGALMGSLCKQIAPRPGTPASELLCKWLASPDLLAYTFSCEDLHTATAMVPSSNGKAFESLVVAKLRDIGLDELYHWLRHGSGPVEEAGAQIARSVDLARPRSLDGILAKAAQRQRLAGAAPLISRMVAALTLPPRRLQSRELPMGGYADVAARGRPEHLLPSQFVLEDLEFVRRFAANELLYFRLEEPHGRLREELVLLLDQGVRTWGGVRLALSAALFAFGKLASRRKIGVAVAGTSNDGRIIDPLQVDEESFSALLEASDLSANPGRALEYVVDDPVVAYRDVILLTHPRSLHEEHVKHAAQRTSNNVRLFAVAVHELGQVQLCAFKRGTPVKLSEFHVDMSKAVPAIPTTPKQAEALSESPEPWRGDVEPYGYPFRLGLTASIQDDLFALDPAGDRLLVVTGNKMLHAFGLRDGRAEVLPRGMIGERVLTHIQAVSAVDDGFVVCGLLGLSLAAFHYDWSTRTCTGHIVVERTPVFDPRWCYTRKHHCVLACFEDRAFGADLAFTDGRAVFPQGGRFVEAAREAESGRWPQQPLHILDGKAYQGTPRHYYVCLHAESGNAVANLPVGHMVFTPLQDGLPCLRNCRIDVAKSAGWNLALHVTHRATGKSKLLLFQGREGVLQHEFGECRPPSAFCLCEHRPLLAQCLHRNQLVVHSFTGDRMPLQMWRGKYQSKVFLELDPDYLVIRVGKHWHLIQWSRNELECTYAHDSPRSHIDLPKKSSERRGTRKERVFGGVSRATQRFDNWVRYPPLLAASDNLGHVALVRPSADLVFMAFVVRKELALWMPDGTRFGPASLIGGPSTPHALLRIAQSVKNAWAKREETDP
jgi:hypothetical protein